MSAMASCPACRLHATMHRRRCQSLHAADKQRPAFRCLHLVCTHTCVNSVQGACSCAHVHHAKHANVVVGMCTGPGRATGIRIPARCWLLRSVMAGSCMHQQAQASTSSMHGTGKVTTCIHAASWIRLTTACIHAASWIRTTYMHTCW